jgi:micrococcal nuclease
MVARPATALLRRLVGGAAAIALLPVVTAQGASAAPEVLQDTWKVRTVIDGDTLWVYDNSGGIQSVRMLGLNAMEVAHTSSPGSVDECHGQQAKSALAALIRPNDYVQLRAIDGSSQSGDRLRRSVWIDPDHDGNWSDALDVQKVLLERGLAVWLPNPDEYTHNKEYNVVASQAAAAKASGSIWDADACGEGPSQDAALKIWVNWDADGDDQLNPNGEYVVVENLSATDVPLAGWWVRDSPSARNTGDGQAITSDGTGNSERYTFPAGSVVKAPSHVTVKVGKHLHDEVLGPHRAGLRQRQRHDGQRRRGVPVRPAGRHPRAVRLPVRRLVHRPADRQGHHLQDYGEPDRHRHGGEGVRAAHLQGDRPRLPRRLRALQLPVHLPLQGRDVPEPGRDDDGARRQGHLDDAAHPGLGPLGPDPEQRRRRRGAAPLRPLPRGLHRLRQPQLLAAVSLPGLRPPPPRAYLPLLGPRPADDVTDVVARLPDIRGGTAL